MSRETGDILSGDQALQELMIGNERFVRAQPKHPRQSSERRIEVASRQQPFGIVLTCADSRVSPEFIFDQGLGDLFVVRVAGNIANDAILGSIEYAAVYLQTPLLVVLGHSNCGAVSATVADGELEGHLPSLAQAIRPAVEQARHQAGNLLDNAIRANAILVAEQLAACQPILANLVRGSQLKIVAAHYDLASGRVSFLL